MAGEGFRSLAQALTNHYYGQQGPRRDVRSMFLFRSRIRLLTMNLTPKYLEYLNDHLGANLGVDNL